MIGVVLCCRVGRCWLTGCRFLLIVGDREVENDEVAVRTQGGEDLGSMKIEETVKLFAQV